MTLNKTAKFNKEPHYQQSSQLHQINIIDRQDNQNKHHSFHLSSNLDNVSIAQLTPVASLKLNIKPKLKNKSIAFSMRETKKGHNYTKSDIIKTSKQKQQNKTEVLQQKSNSNVKIDSQVNVHNNNESISQPYFRKTKLNLTKYVEGNKTRSNKFFTNLEDVNFVKIDSHRVSRYRQSFSEQDREKQKWSKSLERYMDARVKMSQHFTQTKRTSGQFDSLALDKKNRVLQKKKLAELVSLNNSNETKSQKGPFVSNLYGKFNKKAQIDAPKWSFSNKAKDKGQVHRCDALLVNFVGTYFRRKLYKKSRKSYTLRRAKTDYIQENNSMIGLEGQQIDQQMIMNSKDFEQNIKKQIKGVRKIITFN